MSIANSKNLTYKMFKGKLSQHKQLKLIQSQEEKEDYIKHQNMMKIFKIMELGDCLAIKE